MLAVGGGGCWGQAAPNRSSSLSLCHSAQHECDPPVSVCSEGVTGICHMNVPPLRSLQLVTLECHWES